MLVSFNLNKNPIIFFKQTKLYSCCKTAALRKVNQAIYNETNI